MANANGKIIAPVSMRDVQTTLGVNKYNVGELCVDPSINIWAKYKPVVHTDIFASAGRDPIWWKAENATRGIRMNVFNSITTLWQSIELGKTSWEHIKPTGGITSAYRLTDFNGYNHGAKSPITSFAIDKEIEGSTGGRINASIYYTNTVGDDSLSFEDLYIIESNIHTSIENCFLGIAISINNGKAPFRYMTSQVTLSETGGNTVSMPHLGLQNAQEKAILFFSTQRIVGPYTTPDIPANMQYVFSVPGVDMQTVNIVNEDYYISANAFYTAIGLNYGIVIGMTFSNATPVGRYFDGAAVILYKTTDVTSIGDVEDLIYPEGVVYFQTGDDYDKVLGEVFVPAFSSVTLLGSYIVGDFALTEMQVWAVDINGELTIRVPIIDMR